MQIKGQNNIFISREDFDIIINDPSQWDDLPIPPKKNCKKCFGRGYIGKVYRNPKDKTGHYVPCDCVGLKEGSEKLNG